MKSLEICINKLKSSQVIKRLNLKAVKEVIKYGQRGCYSCDGKGNNCEYYQ